MGRVTSANLQTFKANCRNLCSSKAKGPASAATDPDHGSNNPDKENAVNDRSNTTDAASAASGAAPTRQQILEGYQAWLYYEHRLLSDEMGVPRGLRGAVEGTIAEHFHFPSDPTRSWNDVSKPSTRAEAVLTAVGVLSAAPDPLVAFLNDWQAAVDTFEALPVSSDAADEAWRDEHVMPLERRVTDGTMPAATTAAGAALALRKALALEEMEDIEVNLTKAALTFLEGKAA